jgi:hypothetical protein
VWGRGARTCTQCGSLSTCSIISCPASSKPRSRPPMPEKSDTVFIFQLEAGGWLAPSAVVTHSTAEKEVQKKKGFPRSVRSTKRKRAWWCIAGGPLLCCAGACCRRRVVLSSIVVSYVGTSGRLRCVEEAVCRGASLCARTLCKLQCQCFRKRWGPVPGLFYVHWSIKYFTPKWRVNLPLRTPKTYSETDRAQETRSKTRKKQRQ